MLYNTNIDKVIFLDIETVPAYSNYEEVPERFKYLWGKKAKTLIREDDETPESIYDKAGIYAEFGKIVCISIGIVHTIEGGKKRSTV